MKARLVSFGLIEIDGECYDHDVVIDRGRISRRKKGPSKPFRNQFGHTPLSVHEAIPWSRPRLFVGTGTYGQLPIMDAVYDEARRRRVEVVAVPTPDACKMLADLYDDDAAAILHVTC